MHASGSYLKNNCRQMQRNSSSFVPNLHQQGCFDLSQQYVKNQVGFSPDWREHPDMRYNRHVIKNRIAAIFSSRIHNGQAKQLSDIATILEYKLFIHAASKEEYMNQETLRQRMQIQVNEMRRKKGSRQQVDSSNTSTYKTVSFSGYLHARSNGSLPEPTFQKVASPIINGAVTANDNYGSTKRGLFPPSIVHEPVSGGGSNLKVGSKSISSYFPQQQADDLEMDLIKKRNCSGTVQKNESSALLTTMGKSLQSETLNMMIPQHVSREILEVSNLFPGLNSTSSLGDIRQYQPQKLDLQQNFKHFMQPYELCGKASPAQFSSCFVDQGEHCGHMLGQQTLKQSQLPTRLLNADGQLTSENSAGNFGLDGSANVNSHNNSEVSVEKRILPAFFCYENLNNVSGNNKISFSKFLHSTVSSKGICTYEQHSKLLLHSKDCQSDDCLTCCPRKLSHVTDILEHHLEFPSSKIMDSIVRDNDAPSDNFEAVLPPTKRLKREFAFGVSLINNASTDQWTHKIAQPYSSEALPKLQQQPESPLSSKLQHFQNSIVSDNDAPSGNCEAMLPSTKRLKREFAFGVSLINNASTDQWTHKIAQPYSSEALPKLQQQPESLLSSKLQHFQNSIVRYNDAPYGNSEAIPSPKTLKMESAFGGSLINNASSDQWTHKMAQPYSSEALPKLQQQPESPLSCKLQHFQNSIVRDNDAPYGNSEAIPSTETLKVGSACDGSLINNASSDQWTQKMAQPYSSEALPKLQQQPESPLSCKLQHFQNSIVRDNDAPYGNSEAIPSTETLKVGSACGGSLINNASSDQWTHKMAQPYSSEALPKLQQQPESPLSCKLQHFQNSIVRDNDAPYGNSEAIPSTETLKVGSACDGSLINNASSDQWTQKMAQPYSSEALPKLQQQPESPLSCKLQHFQNSIVRDNDAPYGNSEAIPSTETLKVGSACSGSLINNASSDQWTHKMAQPYSSEALPKLQQQPESPLSSIYSEVMECNVEQCTNQIIDSMSTCEMNNVIDDTFGQSSKCEIIPSESLEEAVHLSDEPDPKSHDEIDSSNFKETVIGSNSSMHTLCKDPIAADIEDIQGRTGFNQAGINDEKKVSEPKADQEKETKSSNITANIVSLTEFFTSKQIREHITSLRKQSVKSITKEEMELADKTCQLCAMEELYFAQVPIYCIRCGIRIKRNANYYYRKAEEIDTQCCFCTLCYKNCQGGYIKFNEISVSKTLLGQKRNDEVFPEQWVQCNKCERWQHQVCALYNWKRDLNFSSEYICPICRLKEIEDGMHVPLPKTATFGAKDLPSTMLSDHIEKRLFKCLMQERAEWEKIEGNKNLDEVLPAATLSVREVLSVDKQLKVKKQFRDIFLEENYPAEFPYRSKVILLFQQIEGADVCLFGMYVQEFGSECGYPNQRCVYISYLDSVKYFRPERKTMSGEALRTFVYHVILIGYLDFCKKRGFTTCYIWACPSSKGEDYVLYCHPDTQKTPKTAKLRHWYHSMLRKAAEENIVVGLTNIYDHFFVPTGKADSKVTAARLPYFDGDCWSCTSMDLAMSIEQESGGDYEKLLKKLVPKRTLKAMGHVNPSKGSAKDILVMHKLGQSILNAKESFIMVHLQYVCVHCHEVIVSGKRWFCTDCKKYQECERCHTADSHTSTSGEKHKLCQELMDDIPFDTKENDIILDNGLFENRYNFLSFCQKNLLQFDTLRRAKYSSMMILYHLKNPTLLTVGTICFCCKHKVFQQSWKCEICPVVTVCSACYKERGAECHAHKLSQTYSTSTGNEESKQKSVLMQELLQVIQHASQCCSTKIQPCSYPNCLQIKKLFTHASRCTIRASGGCPYCKKAWLGLTVHSRNCSNSECRIPRCMDLKKHAEWIAMQSESRRRAAVMKSNRELTDH